MLCGMMKTVFMTMILWYLWLNVGRTTLSKSWRNWHKYHRFMIPPPVSGVHAVLLSPRVLLHYRMFLLLLRNTEFSHVYFHVCTVCSELNVWVKQSLYPLGAEQNTPQQYWNSSLKVCISAEENKHDSVVTEIFIVSLKVTSKWFICISHQLTINTDGVYYYLWFINNV